MEREVKDGNTESRVNMYNMGTSLIYFWDIISHPTDQQKL